MGDQSSVWRSCCRQASRGSTAAKQHISARVSLTCRQHNIRVSNDYGFQVVCMKLSLQLTERLYAVQH